MDGKAFSRDSSSQSGSSWCHQTGHTRVLSVAVNLMPLIQKALRARLPSAAWWGSELNASCPDRTPSAVSQCVWNERRVGGKKGPLGIWEPISQLGTKGREGDCDRGPKGLECPPPAFTCTCGFLLCFLLLRVCKQIKQNSRGFLSLQGGKCFLF